MSPLLVAEKLGSTRTAFTLPILAELLEHETDPNAMFLVASASQVNDGDIRQAVLAFLARDDLPYKANAEALVALGVQRNRDDIPYLLQVARDDNKIGLHASIR